MSPILPPELEHAIVLIAFYNDEEMMDTLNLLLVAKRVAEWLYPLIYEVVIIHTDRIWPPMRLTPEKLPRFGQYVRHLLLRLASNISNSDVNLTSKMSNSDIEAYFAYCSNLKNVALWAPYDDSHGDLPLLEYLTRLPHLREVSMDIEMISQTPSDSQSQTLSRITHLDVVTDLYRWDNCRNLIQFSSLTHLSVFWDTKIALISMILENLPKLEVLVLWEGNDGSSLIREGRNNKLPDDPRVVVVSCDFLGGWERSARGIESLWVFAERIIERRRNEQAGKDHINRERLTM